MVTYESLIEFTYVHRIGLIAFAIFLATVGISLIVRKLLKRYFKRIQPEVNSVQTHSFLKHLITACIYLLGIAIAVSMIPSLRSLSISLFAGAGILAAVIGLASQQAFSNVVSGIFIAIFKPYKIGDRVKIVRDSEKIVGKVEDITLRHTVIKNMENNRLIVPNSIMNSEVLENLEYYDKKVCKAMNFDITYESNVEKAISIITEEILKHPHLYDNRSDEDKANNEPIVSVKVMEFKDSAVNLRAWIWAEDFSKSFDMICDLNLAIKKRFDKEGIEFAYPHRVIINQHTPLNNEKYDVENSKNGNKVKKVKPKMKGKSKIKKVINIQNRN